MFKEYCPKCKIICEKDEIELREDVWDGDYENFHITCDTQTKTMLTEEI